MKISIITPSLNQGRFIADAIESIAQQDYSEKEHIIIDAQSSDSTLEVIKHYDSMHHLSWVSEADKGQSDAINKGFSKATGDVVAWLNADDYYQSQTLSRVAKYFSENPHVDIVFGDTMYVNKDKKKLRCKREHSFDYKVLLYYGCHIQTTSTFFRKKIIDSGELLDISFRSTMDYEYFVRLANKGYVFAYLPEVLGVFRWHGGNVSLDLKKAKLESTRVLEQYGFKLRYFPSFQNSAYQMAGHLYRLKRRLLRLENELTRLNKFPSN